MLEVNLRGYPAPVHLVEVVQDDEQAIIGKTSSGKEFVTLPDRKQEALPPLPPRHPFRIYLAGGVAIRALDPVFDDVKEWFLGGGEDEIVVRAEGDHLVPVKRGDVISVLSARPEDEAVASQEAANEQAADEVLGS